MLLLVIIDEQSMVITNNYWRQNHFLFNFGSYTILSTTIHETKKRDSHSCQRAMNINNSSNQSWDEISSDISSTSSTIPQHEDSEDESVKDVDILDPYDPWWDMDFVVRNSKDSRHAIRKSEDRFTKRILADFCLQLEMETANKMIDRELNSFDCCSQLHTISTESEMLRDEKNLELAIFEIRNDIEFLSYGTSTNYATDNSSCFLEPLNNLLKEGMHWFAYGQELFNNCMRRNRIIPQT